MSLPTIASSRTAILLGFVIAAAIVVIGTIATIHFASPASGEPLDLYKVGGSWLIVGAIVGRVVYNFGSDKAKGPAGRG